MDILNTSAPAPVPAYIDAESFGILPNNLGISDKLNDAIRTLGTSGKALYFSIEGTYIIDKAVTIPNDAVIIAKNRNVIFKVASDFDNEYDDFVLRIEGSGLLHVRFENFHLELEGTYGHTLSAFESYVIKTLGADSFIFNNGEINITNSSEALISTCFDFRNINSNVYITNSIITNESGGTGGGILWFRGSVNNVNIINNVLTKNGNDELIAFWGEGLKKGILVENNIITYSSKTNVVCDKLIALNSDPGEANSFNWVQFSSNCISIYCSVKRLFSINMETNIYKSISLMDNYIEYYDTCTNEIIDVIDVTSTKLPSETEESMFNRMNFLIFRNTIVANGLNHRCIIALVNARIAFDNNKVIGTIKEGLVYINTCVSAQAYLNNNDISCSNMLCSLYFISNTATLSFYNNKITGRPIIYSNNNNKINLTIIDNFINCTRWTPIIQKFANIGGEVNICNNVFEGADITILYDCTTFHADKVRMMNNVFKDVGSSVWGDTLITGNAVINGNIYIDSSDEYRKLELSKILKEYYPIGKVIFITSDKTIITMIKKVDGSWLRDINNLNSGIAAFPGTSGVISLPMDNSVKTLTPSGACFINAIGGAAGQRVTIIITTSGSKSYNITFGANYKSKGTLVTGTISGKVFSLDFICSDGTNWIEVNRSNAM
ncbi:MAG: hypothetical protein ACM3X7_00775 [Solirubrobacterales bacterium]